MDRLRAAAARVSQASDGLDAATRDREAAILAAREAGATWEQIADAGGMTRVGAIRAGQRGRARAADQA